MIFDKNWFFEQNLKRNVPANLWYFDSDNGVTMAVHGRHVERLRNQNRQVDVTRMHSHMRLQVYSSNKVLLFSDRPELRKGDERGFGYAAGSLQEFQTFCHYLRMERHCLEVPKFSFISSYGGSGFGLLSEPNDLSRVVSFAFEVGKLDH